MKARIALAIIAILIIAGCDIGKNNVQIEKQGVDRQQDQMNRVHPVPYFETSLERAVVIQLYGIRNEARNTHTVVMSMTGVPVWDCPSVGYPIPYDVQLTNPVKDVAGGAVIEQPEPNGLYSSKNSDATWVLCIDESGATVPIYTEQKASAFPFPVTVDYATGRIVRAGAPTVTVTTEAASSTSPNAPQP